MRVCLDCPALIPTNTSRCPTCTQARDHARGTTTQRGYGTPHQTLKAQWALRIQAGTQPTCPRCGTPIHPDDTWHLDHTDDRTNYLGPSHAHCNTAAAGHARHDS